MKKKNKKKKNKKKHLFGVNLHKCKADVSLLCQYSSYYTDPSTELYALLCSHNCVAQSYIMQIIQKFYISIKIA